jgi:GNAT superfamily N-acetyltransferase
VQIRALRRDDRPAVRAIYVAPEAQGRGIGRAPPAAVVASAEREGIWTVQTGIFPWRDVLLLERRSPRIS